MVLSKKTILLLLQQYKINKFIWFNNIVILLKLDSGSYLRAHGKNLIFYR